MIIPIPYRTILKISFVLSLILFLPLFEQPQEVVLIQRTPTSFTMSIHTPQIRISANKNSAQIFLNMTYINSATGETQKVTPKVFFFSGSNEIKLKTDKPGTYLFEFLSSEVVLIALEPIGVYTISLVIFFIISMVNIIVLTRDYVIYMEN